MHYLAFWQWPSALVFGVLIAATVCWRPHFKQARARGRLLLLIESESLFNDGTAAVAFAIAVGLITGEHLGGIDGHIAGGMRRGAVFCAARESRA